MKKVLFICSQNRLRSPTAERIFSGRRDLEVASAGLNRGADVELSPELIEWADLIFVMEKTHRSRLSSKFRAFLKGKRIICLDIPDDYGYMEPALVTLLERKAGPFLPDNYT
jgi:predicted protein tyrosine phosphatase